MTQRTQAVPNKDKPATNVDLSKDAAALLKEEQRLHHLQSALENSRQAIKAHREALLPVMEELRSHGFDISLTRELPTAARACDDGVPILLKWLRKIDNADVKELIVDALNIPSKRNIIVPALLDEFELLSGDEYVEMKWQMAAVIEPLVNDAFYEKIKSLVEDERHGRSRKPLILSLGKMKKNAPDAIQFLTGLLQQDDLPGHVMIALRKLKGVSARGEVTRYLTNKNSWLKREAKKTLATFDKVEGLTTEPGTPGQRDGAK